MTDPKIIVPPAPAKGGKGSAFQQFVNYWAAHGYQPLKANAPDIQAAANAAKVDPVYFASLLLLESGANYRTSNSSAGAIGIGQLEPGTFVGQPVPWDSTRTITLQDLKDPTTNLRLAAYHVATLVGKFGYAGAYSGQNGTYNPGYTGDSRDPSGQGPQAFIQKWSPQYVPQTPSTSPPGPAGPQVPGGTAPPANDVNTQWAVLRNGKVKFVAAPAPPKGTLTVFRQPLSSSAFLQQYASIADDYQAYTGKRPSFATAASVIKAGTSQFQLRQNLAMDPGFVGSPVWKQNAPGYAAVWHQVYGETAKPDTAAIRNAVANNVGSSAFVDQLRQRPDYATSSEYKQAYAASANVFGQIYGAPTEADHATIDAAVKNGYDANQFASYLRQQPQWKSSAEAQSLYYGLANKLGLIQGNQTVLANG